MSDAPSDEKKPSSMPTLPNMPAMPAMPELPFKIPSEMRLSRKWDQAIERFAYSSAVGTGTLTNMITFQYFFFNCSTLSFSVVFSDGK